MFYPAKLTSIAKGNKQLWNTELKEHCSQEMPLKINYITSINQGIMVEDLAWGMAWKGLKAMITQ